MYERGYGWLDQEHKTVTPPNAYIGIASCEKPVPVNAESSKVSPGSRPCGAAVPMLIPTLARLPPVIVIASPVAITQFSVLPVVPVVATNLPLREANEWPCTILQISWFYSCAGGSGAPAGVAGPAAGAAG